MMMIKEIIELIDINQEILPVLKAILLELNYDSEEELIDELPEIKKLHYDLDQSNKKLFPNVGDFVDALENLCDKTDEEVFINNILFLCRTGK